MRRSLPCLVLLLALPSTLTAQRHAGTSAAVSAPAAERTRGASHAAFARTSFARQRAEADPWFGPDKVRQFFTSAAVQSLGYGTARAADLEHGAALAAASGVTLTLGIGKELSDRRQGRPFSVRDLLWDAAGAAAISVLLARTQR